FFFAYILSNIARGFNHGKRIGFNPKKWIIVEEISCVHAVETAGYVFLCVYIVKYSPWFQPRETYRIQSKKMDNR
ncbi:hypothetical protein ABXT06_19460, partial [Flavobacterium sp. UW10123]|uniref:hypothetical protein n=1 Tax=Flavobacterium sp. UW10123 TaxID=3230800 RepID=UPI0033957A17